MVYYKINLKNFISRKELPYGLDNISISLKSLASKEKVNDFASNKSYVLEFVLFGGAHVPICWI